MNTFYAQSLQCLTRVDKLESACGVLLVRVKLQPQVIGSAGEGQPQHGGASIGPQGRGSIVPSIIHLDQSMRKDMKNHSG